MQMSGDLGVNAAGMKILCEAFAVILFASFVGGFSFSSAVAEVKE